VKASPEASAQNKPFTSPPISLHFNDKNDLSTVTVDRFISGLPSLASLLSNKDDESSMSALLAKNLSQLLSKVPCNSSEYQSLSTEVKGGRCKAIIKLWIVVKVSDKLVSD
jgi:hypothetical protein